MKVCILRGCFRNSYGYGFCYRHCYQFVLQQSYQEKYRKKRKPQALEMKEEYPPIKFKTDIDIYKLKS